MRLLVSLVFLLGRYRGQAGEIIATRQTKAAAGMQQWWYLLCFVISAFAALYGQRRNRMQHVAYAPHLAWFYLRAMTLIIEFQGYSPRRLTERNFPLDNSTNFPSSSKQDEISCFIYYSSALLRSEYWATSLKTNTFTKICFVSASESFSFLFLLNDNTNSRKWHLSLSPSNYVEYEKIMERGK